MSAALCVGKWEMFDSTDAGAHEQARKLCEACPVIDWCAGEAYKARRHAYYGGLHGTWAGRLYGAPQYDEARLAAEDAMFTEAEARAAHTAFTKGIRTDRTRIGERVYQRQRGRAKRERNRNRAAA